MSRFMVAVFVLLVVVAFSKSNEVFGQEDADAAVTPSAVSEEAGVQAVKTAADRLAKAKASGSGAVADQVREITWKLAAGESAASDNVKMYTGAMDAVEAGLEELELLDQKIQSDEALQRELAAKPQVAMRLDLALARFSSLRKVAELSREQERLRLSQLREINREYRSLIEDLLASQNEILQGNLPELDRRLKSAEQHLAQAEKIVGDRRDFYLFEDEPNLDGADSELKFVTSLAEPYSASTAEYQGLVSAHARIRSGLSSDPVDQESLKAGLAKLAELKNESLKSNGLFCLLNGIAQMELGASLVSGNEWRAGAYAEAAPAFAEAKSWLQLAFKNFEGAEGNEALRRDLDLRLLLISDLEAIQSRVNEGFVNGRLSAESEKLLERAIKFHQSADLFLIWIEHRWRSGQLKTNDAVELLDKAIAGGALAAANEVAQLSAVSWLSTEAWRHSLEQDAPNASAVASQCLGRLSTLLDSQDPLISMRSKVLRSFLSVVKQNVDQLSKDEAEAEYRQLGPITAELEARSETLSGRSRQDCLVSAVFGKVAEGYFAVRLEPVESDRAQQAFAAASKLNTVASVSGMDVAPDGSVLLQTMLNRDDASNLRLAIQERGIRAAMQKSFPAILALMESQTTESTSLLTSTAKQVSALSSGSVDANSTNPMAGSDSSGDMRSVRNDSTSVAAMSLLRVRQHRDALSLLLQTVGIPTDGNWQASNVDWSDALVRVRGEGDPLLLNVFAEAMESFAAAELSGTDELKAAMLNDSLDMQKEVLALLSKSVVSANRWPFLKGKAESAVARLTDSGFYLKEASELRSTSNFTAARELLSEGTRRFSNDEQLQAEFLQTLLDEALLSPSQREGLLKQALDAANDIPEEHKSATIYLRLSEVHEQLDNKDAAIAACRKALDGNITTEQSIRAKSRLAALRLSVVSR